MLVAGIVVDVDGDGAELGDFLLERGEGVVVLSKNEGGVSVGAGGWGYGGRGEVYRSRS